MEIVYATIQDRDEVVNGVYTDVDYDTKDRILIYRLTLLPEYLKELIKQHDVIVNIDRKSGLITNTNIAHDVKDGCNKLLRLRGN